MPPRYESDSQALHGQLQDQKPDQSLNFAAVWRGADIVPFFNHSSISLVHANLSSIDAPWTLQLCWLTKRCWRPSAGSMSC
jgi:hypothetical protein